MFYSANKFEKHLFAWELMHEYSEWKFMMIEKYSPGFCLYVIIIICQAAWKVAPIHCNPDKILLLKFDGNGDKNR